MAEIAANAVKDYAKHQFNNLGMGGQTAAYAQREQAAGQEVVYNLEQLDNNAEQ